MLKKVFVRTLVLGLILGLLGGAFMSPWANRSVQAVQADTNAAGKLYLPFVSSYSNGRQNTIFGLEMAYISNAWGLDFAAKGDTAWVRRNALLWDQVEPTEGSYNWGTMSGLENELKNAAVNGMQLILVVRQAPTWAQKIANTPCGQIKPDKYQAFANFLSEAVKRYSVPPYNVKYWQIWNEPDVAPIGVSVPNQVYGCWGDLNDPYYGGGAYANVLTYVYPKVKQANPAAKVIVGGLLIACDPNNDATCHFNGPQFLEGILRHNGKNDGGNYFDGIAFHAYDDYISLGKYGNGGWGSLNNTVGPVVISKARFIRNMLAKYGVSGKMLLNTEAALRCGPLAEDYSCTSSYDPNFELTKAYYVPQVLAAAAAEKLDVTLWYTLNSNWRKTNLLDNKVQPGPAYYAYEFGSQEISNANFVREVKEYSGIKGYLFNRPDHRQIWVLWSYDGNGHSLSLPGVPTMVSDYQGGAVPFSGNRLNVGTAPVYVELPY